MPFLKRKTIRKEYKEVESKKRTNNTRNLFIYWIGKEYKLIKILRDLIYSHSKSGKGYQVHFINQDNIKQYLPKIPDYFYNLLPAHQADFVRVNVICDYGGIWLDSDTLVIDNLDSLFDIVNEKDGFFIKENHQILSNAILGSKKKTTLMKEWKKQMINILDSKKQDIFWTEIGNTLLETIKNKNPELYNNYKIFDGLDNLYPVNWDNCVTEFIEKPYENYQNIVRSYQPLVVLVHMVYQKLEDKTYDEILEGNMPLNYFINKSYENLGSVKNNFKKITK